MSSPPIEGSSSAWQREVRAVEEEGRRAFPARDLERLDAIWSDDLVVNSPTNRVHGKRQILDLLRAGTIAHATLEGEIEVLPRSGDLVVVMGNEAVTDSPGGAISRRRFTNCWRSEGRSWRLIARHANVVGDPQPGR